LIKLDLGVGIFVTMNSYYAGLKLLMMNIMRRKVLQAVFVYYIGYSEESVWTNLLFISSRIKKGEDQGKKGVTLNL
jgi:hypothetical protein